MLPHVAHLTQTLTYWPRIGGSFGIPIVFSPATAQGGIRWSPVKQSRFHNEPERKSVPTISAILQTPVGVGGIVALGTFAGDPWDATDPHEILEYRVTESLLGTGSVQRLIARPLLGQLNQSVVVYPITRQADNLSYTMARGAAAYTGPASVDMLSSARSIQFNSSVLEYDVTVTLPASNVLLPSARYEVDWTFAGIASTLDSMGPIFNNDQSPFWQTLACKLRRPSTGA